LCGKICVREIRARRLALHRRERKSPPIMGKEGDTMYITLADLIQFCLLLVTLVVACYTIFKDKED